MTALIWSSSSGNSAPSGRPKERLVRVQLLIEREDVAENRRAFEQRDAGIVRASIRPLRERQVAVEAGKKSGAGIGNARWRGQAS